MRIIIFDVDGTLSDCTDRLVYVKTKPKNWSAFFAAAVYDKPIEQVVYLNHLLSNDSTNRIFIVTGRSVESRGVTLEWLARNNIRYDGIFFRAEGDHRPDHVVKSEILAQIRSLYGEPFMVFDDRPSVVKQWREDGIFTFDVCQGGEDIALRISEN